MKRISIGEIELNVVEQGTGAPLLLVHGFPLDHQMWKGQLDDLSKDFRVIAPDLRGFGQSDCHGETVLMEQFADDLANLLAALGVDEPITLCGLSMGGYVAWEFWRRHEARLQRLILCDTRAAPDTDEVAATRRKTADQVLREGPEVLVENMIPKLFTPRSQVEMRHVIATTSQIIQSSRPEGLAAALRGMARRRDATPWLPEIKIPSLVLCGQQDVISSVVEMQSIADAIPNASFVVIPACGHMAPLESPTQTNKAIREFLATPHQASNAKD